MSAHTLHKGFRAILKPIDELPEAKTGQSILIVEGDPQSNCGFVVEQYTANPTLNPKTKGWKGEPFTLFHWGRGNQKNRIIGWTWVTK